MATWLIAEGISGADWLQHIEASGAIVTEHNMQVIRTLFYSTEDALWRSKSDQIHCENNEQGLNF